MNLQEKESSHLKEVRNLWNGQNYWYQNEEETA